MKRDGGRGVGRVNVKPSHRLFNHSPCNELSAASIIHRQIRGKVWRESAREKQRERWRRRARLTRITPPLFVSKNLSLLSGIQNGIIGTGGAIDVLMEAL